MRSFFAVLLLGSMCGSVFAQQSQELFAQKLMDEIAAKHPEIVNIQLHMTPPYCPDQAAQVPKYCPDNIIIASGNAREKVGKKSDEADLNVIRSAKPVIETTKVAGKFDTMYPLYDQRGEVIGGVGINIKDTDEASARKDGQKIVDELREKIPSKAKLFERM